VTHRARDERRLGIVDAVAGLAILNTHVRDVVELAEHDA
jgi:hypothetical protein